jgi:three-Cys-motif partner protein
LSDLFGYAPDRAGPDANQFGGAWTSIKLEVLEKYLAAYGSALAQKPSAQNPFRRIYIDAFAGSGRCEVKSSKTATRVIDGSARRALALSTTFHQYVFIELDARKVRALETLQSEYSAQSIRIVQGDANDALTDICTSINWRSSRAVLFLDPFGMEVDWLTLETIAQTKAIDVWYLFPLAGAFRQAAKDMNDIDSDKARALTRVFGTSAWREALYSEAKQGDMFATTVDLTRDAGWQPLLDFAINRLKSIFPGVSQPRLLRQNGEKGAPLFAMCFVCSNPSDRANALAMKLAGDILKSSSV